MSAPFAHPPFMPCPACGASVATAAETEHVCDPDRRLDYELFQLRGELTRLGTEIDEYLASAQGRFEQWYAEYERRPEQPDQPPGGPTDEPEASTERGAT